LTPGEAGCNVARTLTWWKWWKKRRRHVPRSFESPEADVETGKQLRQFFTDLLDGTNLRDYHENTDAYVASQLKAGIITDATARLILDGRLQDIEDNIKLVTGSGSAVPVCIVMPPM
jgi:hypothetical protein